MFVVLGVIALVSLSLAATFLYFGKYKYLIEVTKDIPGAPTLPIIGHGHYFIGQPAYKFPLILTEMLEEYGNTIKVWLGPELNIMTGDVKIVEAVLSSMAFVDKAGEYDMLRPWLQEGLLVSQGKKWHQRRKIITPAFHFKILDEFIETFEEESRKLVRNLETELKKDRSEGIRLYDWINLCTLDTICGSRRVMFLAIGCFFISISIIALYLLILKYVRMIRLTREWPSPPTLPIIGHAHHLLNLPPERMMSRMFEFARIYGNSMKIWIGLELNFIMADVRDIEYVLGTTFLNDKASEYEFLRNWLREGLLISEGRKWFQRRRILTPAFHFKILEEFIQIFEKESRILVENLEKERGKCPINGLDLYNWFNLCTLDTIAVLGSIILVSLSLAILFLYIVKYKHMIDVTKDIPGPPALPLIGSAHLFMGQPPYRILYIMMDLLKKYGDTIKIWLGPELNILTCDLKIAEIVLSSMTFVDKAGEYDMLGPWLQEGLLVSQGKKWHQRRKIITPAFHFKILDEFIETFEEESRTLVRNLEKELKKDHSEGIRLYDWINLCTLDTICETAMGVSVNAQTNTDSEYVRAVKTIATVLHKRMFDILYRFDLTYMFTSLAREEKKALHILHGFTEKIILQRREELLRAQSEKRISDENDVGAKRKMAFLDILLQSEIDGKPLTNLDIREEVDTFMFEGHDTTSSAVTFFFYNIALNPECQRRCYEEIIAVLGKDKSKPVSFEDLNNMRYVELCIKETLRLYPSVPLLGRRVNKECEINGKIIPAGANIGISPLHLGRLPELFPEPLRFKPERFDVVTSAEKMNPYAYVPFSAGPRNCIGQKFAMLEIKTIVANVLRNFEVSYTGDPHEEVLLIGELILRPKDPLMFHIKPRTID